jgi:hypothetical protein
MAKSRTRTDFVREWGLSAIGRRLLREGRQFAAVLDFMKHGLFLTDPNSY